MAFVDVHRQGNHTAIAYQPLCYFATLRLHYLRMTRYDLAYRQALARIFDDGDEVFSQRTGFSTRALPGLTFELEPASGFPLLTLRKIPIKLFCAEVVWMLTGEKKLDFLRPFTKIWDDFAEEDGTIEAAYGYRWRRHFGRDQLVELVEHLREEPTSRQGVVVMWDPSSDGLRAPKRKNVPCPFCWTANIIGNRLNLHVIIRSNDMMLGNPHDTAGFALLQALLAQELGVGVGKLTVSISHAHVYENHYEQAREVIARDGHTHEEIACRLPERAFARALGGDAGLVE
ncbi:thymidylate synthase, partial [Candidatus Parcubacteria bacterium]|nr:thymidylate synthase [Candidatus Parcubacteria bacterium]